MSLSPLTLTEQSAIIKNLASACRDIRKLNSNGYKFIHLASGFIAHYNRFGFIDAYSEPGALERAIRANAGPNQWSNFRPGERHFDYYLSKRMVYNGVLSALNGNRG